MFSTELLDAWCNAIRNDYEISSAVGIEDSVFICFDSNQRTEELFSDYKRAEKYFKDKMPDDLFRQVLCFGFNVKAGANYFHFPSGEKRVIGYVVILEKNK